MRRFCYQNQLIDPSDDTDPDKATINITRAHFAHLQEALAAGRDS